jgi:ABC-type nickel/cobalt efflux system permease component RcnA
MSGDVAGWINIVDRLDVWGLALLVLVGGWRIVRSLDRIERCMSLHAHRIDASEKWQQKHDDSDDAEHRRIYDAIAAGARR